jgi:hypothetical protein
MAAAHALCAHGSQVFAPAAAPAAKQAAAEKKQR